MYSKQSTIKIFLMLFFSFVTIFTSNTTYCMEDDSTGSSCGEVVIDIDSLVRERADQCECEGQSEWNALKELYLPSLLKVCHENKPENGGGKQEEKTKDPHELLQEAFSDISEEEKIKLSMDLFAKVSSAGAHTYSRIVDDTTYRDLNIFCGNPGTIEHSFVRRTGKTQTIAGRVAYLNLLYNPLCDIGQLTIRQNGIRMLVENEFLFRELFSRIKRCAEAESCLLACWHKEAQRAVEAIMERLYVKDPLPCPQIPSCGSQWLQSQFDGTNSWVKKHVGNANTWLSETANTSANYLDAKRVFQLATKPIFDVTGVAVHFSKQFISLIANNPLVILDSQRLERVILNLLLLAGTWYLPEEYKINIWRTIIGSQVLFYTAESYKDLYKTEQAALTLHKLMSAISRFMVAAGEVIDFVQSYPELSNAITTCMQGMDSKQSAQSPAQAIINALDSDCFKTDARLLGRRGKALATFFDLKRMKDELIPYYTFIGNVDSLLSIATLVKELGSKLPSFIIV